MGKQKLDTAGWMVADEKGPLVLCTGRHYPSYGLLTRGTTQVTLFPTRGQAIGASTRSLRYAAENGYPWAASKHRVMRVVRPTT